MTTIRVASVLTVVTSSLLIAGLLENAAKIQQAIAYNSILLTKNNNDGALNVGLPEKMTIAGESKPTGLSPEKKLELQQAQEKTHHSPELSISDQAIDGPKQGTQSK